MNQRPPRVKSIIISADVIRIQFGDAGEWKDFPVDDVIKSQIQEARQQEKAIKLNGLELYFDSNVKDIVPLK